MILNFHLISSFGNNSVFHPIEKFSNLSNFICEVAKDVAEKDSDLRTIALVIMNNNFPSTFSAQILKCLPNVTKVILMPHTNYWGIAKISLPKQSMIICLADERNKDITVLYEYFEFFLKLFIIFYRSKISFFQIHP